MASIRKSHLCDIPDHGILQRGCRIHRSEQGGRHDSVNLLKLIMMDAILAVAIGGNSLGGGSSALPVR
jgi:hypothetical protein